MPWCLQCVSRQRQPHFDVWHVLKRQKFLTLLRATFFDWLRPPGMRDVMRSVSTVTRIITGGGERVCSCGGEWIRSSGCWRGVGTFAQHLRNNGRFAARFHGNRLVWVFRTWKRFYRNVRRRLLRLFARLSVDDVISDVAALVLDVSMSLVILQSVRGSGRQKSLRLRFLYSGVFQSRFPFAGNLCANSKINKFNDASTPGQ